MQLQVGVKLIIQNKQGKFLLLHRSVKKYPDMHDRLWDIVGGRIDPGVSLFKNLKREVVEETGLILEQEPQLIAAQDIIHGEKHVIRLTYSAELEGEIVLSDEHDQYQWFVAEEIENLEGLDPYFLEVFNKTYHEKF